MPVEIKSEEEFVKIAKTANQCRIKKLKDVVKLKLRTPNVLYTFKTTPAKAEELIKGLEIEKVEL